jgi:hypothetical protein
MATITELKELVDEMPEDQRQIFDRIFYVSSSVGELEIPDTCEGLAWQYFGNKSECGWNTEKPSSVTERLEEQKIIRIRNKVTGEEALFNELRSSRPGMRQEDVGGLKKKVLAHIDEAKRSCYMCHPEELTANDVFDRIKGKHCITGANIAKYDAWSGMLYFRKHSPLEFELEELSDYIDTAFNWFRRVHKITNEEFEYPFLMWNCLERAGASRVHGHMQMLLAKEMAYAEVENLRKASQNYKKENKDNPDYFKDLFSVHEALGLGIERSSVLAYLTPIKDKEVMIIGKNIDEVKKSSYETLRCFIDRLGVLAFNFVIQMPPFGSHPEWRNFPYVARVIDRGSPLKLGTDIASMELYGSKVIGADPFKVIDEVSNFMER